VSKTPKPLELKQFYVLLALSKEPMNAYAVHAQVLSDSHSSLYFSFTSLRRILEGLVRRDFAKLNGAYLQGMKEIPTYAITLGGIRLLKAASTNLLDASMLAKQRLP
jgi:DNA-binding PadR family transcriptional regulator